MDKNNEKYKDPDSINYEKGEEECSDWEKEHGSRPLKRFKKMPSTYNLNKGKTKGNFSYLYCWSMEYVFNTVLLMI